MIIRITDGSTTQTLAAGPARDTGLPVGPSGLRIAAPTTIQPRPRLRAGAVKNSDRGNVAASVAFSVFYEFDSYNAAEYFIATHRLSVLRSGTLQLVTDLGGINAYSDSVVADPQISQINGVSIRVDYQVACGPETYSPPAFTITEPSGGWLRTFDPNSATENQAAAFLATVIYDSIQETPGSYTITEPSAGWLRTIDPDHYTEQALFDVIATLGNEFSSTEETYLAASMPFEYTLNPNLFTEQILCNVLATFINDLQFAGTIG